MNMLHGEYTNIESIVLHQLHNHWLDVDTEIVKSAIPDAMNIIEESFNGLPSKRYFDNGTVLFSPYISLHWMLFLYRLSHVIYLKSGSNPPKEADQCYYLNKILHGIDWFYSVELPVQFLCEHPLGSVLGRAHYGDHLFVYQGTTVGGNRSSTGLLSYPTLGDNVILFANSTILGNSSIGNNVIISADTYIINETIPDNSIVFGKSPNLIIKTKSESDIKQYTSHIWNWSL